MPTFIATLRFIAPLPAAFIAGWLGYFLMPLAWKISLSMRGIDFHEAWIRVCDLAASGLAMGAAYVYAGANTAPSYKQHTAIGPAVIAGVIVGTTIALAFTTGNPDYWSLWQGACLV